MKYAKWVAILAVAGSTVGCVTPCQRVASQAVAFDKDCAKVALDKGDGQLAVACASAYGYVKRGLTTGSCSNEVGTR